MSRVLVIALLVAGCGTGETGFLLEVQGPSGITSTEAGIDSLELLMAHPSWCERWVLDDKASHTKATVGGRDLSASPYTFLVKPVRETNVDEEVHVVVLGRNAASRVIAQAGFGRLKWSVGDIRKFSERAEPIFRGMRDGGPEYIAGDGCICMPGHPWIGNGSRSGCDLEVLPSFARLADTRECELPPRLDALPTQVCDGQNYPGETMDRKLPCFAVKDNACHIATRGCYDHNGVAYEQECFATTDDPPAPQGMCDAYLACERTACGDILACFRQKLSASTKPLRCTLRVNVASDGKVTLCTDPKWVVPTDFGCGGALLDGQSQPPYQLGLISQIATAPSATVAECPFAVTVTGLDTTALDQIPYTQPVYVVAGEKLLALEISIAVGCFDVPAFSCQ